MGSSNSKSSHNLPPTVHKIYNCSNGTFSGLVRKRCDDLHLAEGPGVIVGYEGKYMGNFADNQRCGEGEVVTNDGTIFKSNYTNDEQSGATTVVRDGIVYVGQSVKGKLNGSGKVYLTDGSYWDAYFVANTLVSGTYHDFNYTYVGAAYAFKPHGTGVKTFKDGTKFEGMFYNNKFTGAGKIMHADGRLESGIFVDGKLVEAEIINPQVTPGHQ